MSCQSCVAARDGEISQKALVGKEAQALANSSNTPRYILTTPDGYEISTTQQPNTVEVKLPNNR